MSKKCRASNPATCQYHGSPVIVENLIAKGDIDGYISHRTKLDTGSDHPEKQTPLLSETVDPLEKRDTNQLNTKGESVDRADAKAIYEVYKGLQSVRCASPSYVHRAAREAIQKIWQEPRMPSLKFAHNKPLAYPWSPKARELFFSGKATGGALVLEHVTPISILRDKIFDEISKPDCTEETIYKLLQEEHKPLSFTIITKKEDTELGRKFKNSVSTKEGAYGRYEEALNLKEEDFLPATQDPKYPEWALKQENIKKERKENQRKARLAKKALKKASLPLAS
jgi:hypothetical protein